MARFSGLHLLFFSFIIATGTITVVSGTVFTIVNSCSFTVWPGILTGDNGVQLNDGGFELAPGASVDVTAPAGCSTGHTRRIHNRHWWRAGQLRRDCRNAACPRAYSYAYDDRNTSLFTCTNANYSIVFCPKA
ncbi:BnaC05g14970D [Brassica napus]|uniref:BnaC05g14970D protein n=1 Tax=Brassica napus TaxID=3708 RepID=A0A078HUN0_BRANA|nr:BnaC05g14970D [Brassica napus]